MKAMVQRSYQGIDDLQLVELPQPKNSLLGTLVKVDYVPVLPWDIRSERGEFRIWQPEKLPKVLGYGFAGTVQSSHIGGFTVNTRVAGVSPTGSYLEVANAVIPGYLFPIPETVTTATAATVFGGADTAWMMQQSVPLQVGEHVLVVGATGGVGSYLVQFLIAKGLQVEILSSSRSLDYTQTIFPNISVVDDASVIPPNHFHAIFDTSGHRPTIQAVETKLRAGGFLFPAGIPDYQATRPDIQVIFKNRPISPRAYRQIFAKLNVGEIQAHISQVFELERTQAAQHFVDDQPARGRVVVHVG